jgi:ABC-type dipeptide/oligopeptide/nickel transport system permease subunit
MEKKQSGNQDFTLVQLDKKIHDVKFQTKPTTYFKDAFKRFRKNKSSVVAGVIIGILSILAVTVPIFNTNSIDRPLFEARFLPPKWPGFSEIGIMDGTTYYQNVIIDKLTDPNNPLPVGFQRHAILGDIEIKDTFSNFPSPYATGGLLALRSNRRDSNGFLSSVGMFLNISIGETNVRVILNEINAELDIRPTYRIIAYVDYQTGVSTIVPLTAFSDDYGTVTLNNVSSIIANARPDGMQSISFRTRFGVELETTQAGAYPVLYLDSFQVKSSSFDTFNDPSFTNINFTSGNEVMLRDDNANTTQNKWAVSTASKSVFQAILPRGNFRYDNYAAAFGEIVKAGIGQSVVDVYIANGWMNYDFNVGPSSFELLNEELSPIREVISQEAFGFGQFQVKSLTVVISIYREKGFSQMPSYIFGTDVNGNDYFKIIFSGLGTSLLLGVLVALINVAIGMVWGALSGYYGGWIDIAMERFTEILGGVPWIVLMTLTILLLGSNFGTFLLALTLTGWIGTASLTRSQFYRYKRREYVLASRTLGAKDGRLIFRHILPNSIGPIVTSSVLIIPGVIFSEAAISYLGLGLQGLPSLGVALARAQGYLQTSPHLTMFGAIIISLLLISFNLFGNGLRDAFNPSLKGISE